MMNKINYSPISLNSGRILFSVSTISEASSSTSDDKHEKEKREQHKQVLSTYILKASQRSTFFYIQAIYLMLSLYKSSSLSHSCLQPLKTR